MTRKKQAEASSVSAAELDALIGTNRTPEATRARVPRDEEARSEADVRGGAHPPSLVCRGGGEAGRPSAACLKPFAGTAFNPALGENKNRTMLADGPVEHANLISTQDDHVVNNLGRYDVVCA